MPDAIRRLSSAFRRVLFIVPDIIRRLSSFWGIDHIWAIFPHPRSHPRCSVRASFASASVTLAPPLYDPPRLADPLTLPCGEGRGGVSYFIA